MIARALRISAAAAGAISLAGCVTLSSISLRATEDRRGETLAGEITLTFSPPPPPALPVPRRFDGKSTVTSPTEPPCASPK